MAKVQVYIGVIKGKTEAPHGRMKRKDAIIFHNNSPTGSMTITIDGEDGAGIPLCTSRGGAEKSSFTVASKKEAQFVICPEYKGRLFKYSAQVEGAKAKDPIIIIE